MIVTGRKCTIEKIHEGNFRSLKKYAWHVIIIINETRRGRHGYGYGNAITGRHSPMSGLAVGWMVLRTVQDISEINLRHGTSANVGGNTRSGKAGSCKQEGRHEAATLLTQSSFEISAADRARSHRCLARNDRAFYSAWESRKEDSNRAHHQPPTASSSKLKFM